MGWGCYKHEMDAGSDEWQKKVDQLSVAKLKEDPRTWGRDGEVCPSCWEEQEAKLKAALLQIGKYQSLVADMDRASRTGCHFCRFIDRKHLPGCLLGDAVALALGINSEFCGHRAVPKGECPECNDAVSGQREDDYGPETGGLGMR